MWDKKINNSQAVTWKNRCSSAQIHTLPVIIAKNYKVKVKVAQSCPTLCDLIERGFNKALC